MLISHLAQEVSPRQRLALPLSESLSPAGKESEYVTGDCLPEPCHCLCKISRPLFYLPQIPLSLCSHLASGLRDSPLGAGVVVVGSVMLNIGWMPTQGSDRSTWALSVI